MQTLMIQYWEGPAAIENPLIKLTVQSFQDYYGKYIFYTFGCFFPPLSFYFWEKD